MCVYFCNRERHIHKNLLNLPQASIVLAIMENVSKLQKTVTADGFS